MSEYRDTKGPKDPKLLVNVPIDHITSRLSKAVKHFRFCTDEEGNVWAMPIVGYRYDPTTGDMVESSPVFARQADAAISQANPVSATLYPVLPTTLNCRIHGIEADITWAVTQPTPLAVVVTIDGNTITHSLPNPISGNAYYANIYWAVAENAQTLSTGAAAAITVGNPLYEGRSVAVAVWITWGVTQPTPLNCRVKYSVMV